MQGQKAQVQRHLIKEAGVAKQMNANGSMATVESAGASVAIKCAGEREVRRVAFEKVANRTSELRESQYCTGF